jgi:hypothetical protein
MREHGSLSVTWLSPAPPWVAYRVVVDDVEVGRVGYRRSAYIPLVAGPHHVELRSRKPVYGSEAVPIDVSAGGRLDLFGGRRQAEEQSIWLGFARSAPPIIESDPTRSRWAGVWSAVVIFWLLVGVVSIAQGRWASAVLSVGFLAVGLAKLRRDLAARRRPQPQPQARVDVEAVRAGADA